MIIFIDEIDSESCFPLGYTNLPSFIAKFKSAEFEGVARFVPASGLPQDCAGHEFGVEIAQDSITDFQIVSGGAGSAIEPLSMTGSFRVRGKVRGSSGPAGRETTTVAVGEAFFTLTPDDVGQLRPAIGDTVIFILHGLSLWDEVI
ncbi:hypothetical protein IFT68_06425 [Oxalobacteraceae sp. CFBP 13730]|jgi:hypothetical protein|nr:hypothetical protein [Oxalobacteraceae sp. CFBP 13730]